MPFLLRRMLETVGFQCVLSLIFSSLFHFGVLEQTMGMVAPMMIFSMLFNLIYLSICLKGYMVYVDSLKSYFVVNYLVLLVLCGSAILLAAFNVEPLYTFLFFPFKFFSTVFATTKVVAALITSGCLVVYVAIAPLFMRIPVEEPEE